MVKIFRDNRENASRADRDSSPNFTGEGPSRSSTEGEVSQDGANSAPLQGDVDEGNSEFVKEHLCEVTRVGLSTWCLGVLDDPGVGGVMRWAACTPRSKFDPVGF